MKKTVNIHRPRSNHLVPKSRAPIPGPPQSQCGTARLWSVWIQRASHTKQTPNQALHTLMAGRESDANTLENKLVVSLDTQQRAGERAQPQHCWLFSSQHLQFSWQLSGNPVPEDQTPSSSLSRHQACTQCTCLPAGTHAYP